ncbi:MAG: SDR family oxidoreductase [Candidatus Kapabacteria bacterium]|nr:SDR family oxidoreductase [Candidatus Kapabacteria bacterium]
MKFNLQNLNALVCGGSQGIGEAISIIFAESGANVTLLSRDEEKLKTTLKKLPIVSNQSHSYVVSDLSNIEKLKNEIIPAMKSKNSFDIIINNSGGPKPGLLYQADPSELMTAFNQHILASHIIIKAFVPKMIENSFGRIINVISVGLKQPIKNLGVSNTIRGAMGSWAKTLSKELGQYGITVNNILPGHTLTPRLKSLIENRAETMKITTEDIMSKMIEEIPVKRLGEPRDIAIAAAFLASKEAGFVNGINFPVDGGWLDTL